MTNTRKSGFTLIELLIVVVIIGILAAIAIPKFASTKGQAFLAAMRSDLRNLATAEEGYYYSNNAYSNNLGQLNFLSSAGVTISVPEATSGGWSGLRDAHVARRREVHGIFRNRRGDLAGDPRGANHL